MSRNLCLPQSSSKLGAADCCNSSKGMAWASAATSARSTGNNRKDSRWLTVDFGLSHGSPIPDTQFKPPIALAKNGVECYPQGHDCPDPTTAFCMVTPVPYQVRTPDWSPAGSVLPATPVVLFAASAKFKPASP
jgi:hypothetical protein